MFFAASYARRPPLSCQHTTQHLPREGKLSAGVAFSRGRVALKVGLQYLNLPDHAEILVPDVICQVALQPLQQLQLTPVYFPVNNDLSPDLQAIKKKISPRTRALMMVHYFGVPQQVADYQSFCAEHDLYLIDDNAHGYGGTVDGTMMGALGDIGISSPWKNFPVRYGGLLHLPSTAQSWLQQRSKLPEPGLQWLPARRAVMERFQAGWLAVHRQLFITPQNSHTPAPLSEQGMPGRSLEWLDKQELSKASKQRRKLYTVWQQWSAAHGLQSLFQELPSGSAPLAFPMLAASPQQRRHILESFWKHKIDAWTWPKLPDAVFAESRQAVDFQARLVCLPIHQYMDEQQLAQDLRKFNLLG